MFLGSILCHVRIVLFIPSIGEGEERPIKIWLFKFSLAFKSRSTIKLTLKCCPTTLTTGLNADVNYQSTPS